MISPKSKAVVYWPLPGSPLALINLVCRAPIAIIFRFIRLTNRVSVPATEPELASDIIDKGIVMSGGTSLLRNFDKLMTQEIGVPAHVAEEPIFCVVKGISVALENIELYKRSITRR